MSCDKKSLLTSKRGRGVDNTGRGIAMKLCEEQGGMKLLEMTELFNVGSESGVSRSVTRMNGLRSDLELFSSTPISPATLTLFRILASVI